MATSVTKGLCGPLFLLTLIPLSIQGQQTLRLVMDDAPEHARILHLKTPQQLALELRTAVADLQRVGHLEAACDSCHTTAGTVTCHFHVGPVYRWARLSPAGVPPEIASAARIKERFFTDRPISPLALSRLFESLLKQCEDNGHPFAMVQLKDLRQEDEGLYGTVHLDRGPFVRIDSLVIKGDARLNMRYLQAQVGVRPGDPYNESIIRQVAPRLKELPYVQQRQPPYVLFTEDKARLYVFIDARRASSINGIIGFQPDPASGRIRVTGDIDLRLRNALRGGEAIDLNWRSLADQTQDLKLRVDLPYLFRTPFGIDAALTLFKRDTTFLDVNTRFGIQYRFGRNDRVLAFVNNRSSDRLGNSFTPQPGLADVKVISYGISIQRERFDYRFNPRRGLGIWAELSVGNKKVGMGTVTDPSPATSAGDQILGELNVIKHVPLGQRATLRLVGKGATLVNDQLFTNELFRIGGIKSFRGVDEASIYASSYAIGTVEWRWLYEENANFFVFVDQGYWVDASRSEPLEDGPTGFGVGTNFETKAGIFSLTYALGQQFNNPVELRAAKVHFGFTSLF
ncbi:MAG: hypothetical protein JNM31_11410 [Flavobacteriales bacterium]|nr:hypothetical protein [Flavobacteriales bacterium]